MFKNSRFITLEQHNGSNLTLNVNAIQSFSDDFEGGFFNIKDDDGFIHCINVSEYSRLVEFLEKE